MARANPDITAWLAQLGVLAAGPISPQEAKARVAAFADAIGREFPAAAFTPESLHVVARQCRYFPSYAELCGFLGAWWRERRPPPRAITADISYAAKARRERAEAEASWRDITPEQIRSKIRALDGNPMRDVLGHFLAVALRRHAKQHLGLLPPKWLEETPDQAEARSLARMPAEKPLTAEQLATARAELQAQRAAAQPNA